MAHPCPLDTHSKGVYKQRTLWKQVHHRARRAPGSHASASCRSSVGTSSSWTQYSCVCPQRRPPPAGAASAPLFLCTIYPTIADRRSDNGFTWAAFLYKCGKCRRGLSRRGPELEAVDRPTAEASCAQKHVPRQSQSKGAFRIWLEGRFFWPGPKHNKIVRLRSQLDPWQARPGPEASFAVALFVRMRGCRVAVTGAPPYR